MLLFFQGNIIIVVFSITRDVFYNLNEWREVHALLFCNTLCFKYHQIIHRRFEGIQFKILTFPDKTLAMLLDGLAVKDPPAGEATHKDCCLSGVLFLFVLCQIFSSW